MTAGLRRLGGTAGPAWRLKAVPVPHASDCHGKSVSLAPTCGCPDQQQEDLQLCAVTASTATATFAIGAFLSALAGRAGC